MPDELRVEVAVIFKTKSLSLLKNRSIWWNRSDSQAILQILKDPQLKWSKDESLEAMGYISESSNNSSLLLIFPDLLDYFYKSDLKQSELTTRLLADICKTWFHNLIDDNETYDSEFMFDLLITFPTVGKYFKELLADCVKKKSRMADKLSTNLSQNLLEILNDEER